MVSTLDMTFSMSLNVCKIVTLVQQVFGCFGWNLQEVYEYCTLLCVYSVCVSVCVNSVDCFIVDGRVRWQFHVHDVLAMVLVMAMLIVVWFKWLCKRCLSVMLLWHFCLWAVGVLFQGDSNKILRSQSFCIRHYIGKHLQHRQKGLKFELVCTNCAYLVNNFSDIHENGTRGLCCSGENNVDHGHRFGVYFKLELCFTFLLVCSRHFLWQQYMSFADHMCALWVENYRLKKKLYIVIVPVVFFFVTS